MLDPSAQRPTGVSYLPGNFMALLDGSARRPADELRRVARYQRWVVAVLLAELALWVGYVVIGVVRGEPLAAGMRFPIVLTLALGGVGGVYTFLIYWVIRGPFLAVVMGLASLPPALGTIVLLLANATATKVLSDHGVRAGLFGAFESDIPDDEPEEEDADW